MAEQDRRCGECGLLLSRYNRTLVCGRCAEKALEVRVPKHRSAREEREYQSAELHRLAPNNRAFGDRLAAFRKGAGLTQLQLATRSGLAFTVVSNAEYGRNQPTARSLFALARALGVSMDELYGGKRGEGDG